jgi:hypothetical protein
MRYLAFFYAVLFVVSTAAQAGEIDFTRRATADEVKAATRDAKKDMDAATNAGMAVEVWVGQQGQITALRLMSQALCGAGFGGEGAMSNCPTLVYLGGTDKPPVWRGMAGESLTWPQK